MLASQWLFLFAAISGVANLFKILEFLGYKMPLLSRLGSRVGEDPAAIAGTMRPRGMLIALLFSLFSLVLSAVGFALLPSKPPGVTPDNVEANVRGWLDTFHLGVRRLPDNQDWHFAYEITNAYNRRTNVIRLRALDRYLIIQSRIIVGEPHQQRLAALPADEAQAFNRDLMLDLARLKIGFADVAIPLRNITLERRLPITEGLTEASFIQALDDVDSAEVFLLNAIDQRANQAARRQNR